MSAAENYAKLCIVAEEGAEALFRPDLLIDSELMKPELLLPLQKESEELLKVFATSRKSIKSRINTIK